MVAQEYDIAAVGRGGKEAIAKQKQSLRRRLGLDECERFMDVSDIIRDEDLEAPAQAAAPPATGSSNPAAAAVGKQKQKQEATAGIKRGAQDLMAEMLPSGTSPGVGDGGSSAGSVSPALICRPSVVLSLFQLFKAPSLTICFTPPFHRSCLPPAHQITVEQVAAEGDDWEEEEEEEGEWPLQALCEQLLTDMFHPVWEVRHGSILALREVMSAHGNCAAVCRPIVPSKWASANGNEEIEDGNGKMELEVVKEEDDGKTVPEMRELDVGLVKAPMVSSEKEEEGVNKKMEVVDHWGIRKEERVEAEGLEDVKQEVKEREFVSKPLVAVKREIEVGTSLKAEVKEEAKGEEEGMKTRAEEELKVEDEMGVIEGRLEGVKREAKAESKEGSGGWLGLSMGSETPKESNGESASGGKLAATAGVCVKEEAGEGGGKGGEDNRAERSGFDLNELLVCKVEDTEASVTNQEGVINQNSGGRARMGLDLHLSDGMQSEEMGEGVVRNLGNEKSIEGIKVEANTDEAEEKSKREGSEKAVGKGLDLNMEVSEEANEGKHVDGGEVAEEKNGEEKESALVVAQRVRAAEKGATATMESARKAQLAIEAARKAQADNELFLEDCAIRLLCIFALDRLEDFVSDQVVAPVREACGQALGVVLKYLPSRAVARTLDVLLQMQNRSEWEVRHGALLGIKYLIAVRQELLPSLLPSLLPACIRALQDSDDDVRAVAAEALLPAAKTVGEGVDESDLRQLMRLLWGILSELDDLSPSTSSVMTLLAELHALPRVAALWTVPPSRVASLTRPVIHHWCQLIATPPGGPLDTSLLFATSAPAAQGTASRGMGTEGKGRGRGRGGRGKGKGKELEGVAAGSSAGSSAAAGSALGSGGSGVVVVGAEGESAAVRMRVDTSQAMGLLLSFWPVVQLEGGVAPLISLLGSVAATQKQVGALIIAAWFRELEKRELGKMEVEQTDSQQTLQKPNQHQQQQQQQYALGSLPGLSLVRPSPPVEKLLNHLMALLCSPDAGQSYEELSRTYNKLRAEASALISHARALGLAPDTISSALTRAGCVGSAGALDSSTAGETRGKGGTGGTVLEGRGGEEAHFDRLSPEGALELAGALAGLAGSGTGEVENRDAPGGANMHTSVTATVAAAAVRVSLSLPSKLNPIIQPLMAALKREREVLLQQCVASGLASVILRSLDRRPSPNDRLLKNLSTLACSDPSQCPPPCDANKEADDPLDPTLAMPAAAGAGGAASKGAAGVIVKGEGAAGSLEAMIGRRGAELSFRALADSLGPDLFTKLPKLWGLLTEVWKPGESEGGGSTGKCDEGELFKADPLALVNTFQLIRCLSLVLHTSLIPQLLLLLPPVLCCTRHPHAAVRFASAQCLAALVSLLSAEQTVLSAILTHVIPQLTNTLSEPARRGAASVVSSLVNTQGEMLAPYAALLVVPLLARMSDPSPQVRQLVTQSFARLVPLLPLARGLPLPAFLDKEGARKAREDARFLEQLLDNRKADDYQLQVKLSVTLRRYQQEGVNWLAFLRRFHLHGVLCDDMGLGKTLQASSMLASDTIERQAAARAAATGPTSAADRAAPGASGFGVAPTPLLPSLIVCPPTLVAHWVYEIEKYIPRGIFFPLQYAGSVADRQRMRGQLRKHNLVVTSYEVLRSDIDELAAITWRYCVLDEGHLIKGAKTRLSQAVRRIKAEHRLLLTGTPIQNNVLELWALFDFLMPGFLGTEKQFQARYGKPLQAARDPKCTAKQAEAGALAMEALHRQVMPFILRRTKEQVLSDLPPKIITDRYCQLSTLQRLLYADFSKSHASEEVVTAVTAAGGGAEGGGGEQASTHVFQALQYLRKLCSHPLLVLDPSHPRHAAALAAVGASGAAAEAGPRGGSSSGAGSSGGDGVGDVHDIVHAPKLVALRDILLECGIGGGGEGKSGGDVGGEASEGNHRVLVFAQLKSFLDIVEEDLFKKHMPGVSYLRIDGSVEPSRRFDLVKAFNSDPTIDVLLLTTHVGGLGLNLTAADTVVFLEHDWNPMRDLQAMDRAHRLGQRRTVNVHRVIMAGTLEEKVMGLQRFKLSIANAVVNADNASLKSMDTSQLLDLFNAGPPAASAGAKQKPADSSSDAAVAAAGGGKGLKAVLTGLEDLWDESQYAEEYNLDNFLKRI
ncbi:unnamed protein product [Closterium sp. NIES-65]|nr:unnamed protein product [Closterium sp. NIES-65]